MLSRKNVISAVIVIFVAVCFLEFKYNRNDWPFGKFGMYSDIVYNKEICTYEVEVDLHRGEKVEHISWDNKYWIIENIYKSHDQHASKEEFAATFDPLLVEEGKKIIERYKDDDLIGATIYVNRSKWKHRTAENYKKPEEFAVIYEKFFSAQ
jgi:hypothetical protein